MAVTKAFIVVAGYGTRRLPVSKAVEKCMLPVGNRPIVDYVVQDCLTAGIREFYFVVSSGATQIQQYYRRDAALEEYLEISGKTAELALLQKLDGGAQFHFIEQPIAVGQPYGTTVPVALCAPFLDGREQALVIMGDQFMYNPDGQSEAAYFLRAAAKAGTPSAMLGVEVPRAEVYRYGIIQTKLRRGTELFENIIEKPTVQDAPSNLNNASFYLFDKTFFDFVQADMSKPHPNNQEYMLTDVLNAYCAAGNTIAVIRNRGEYLDCGNLPGWLAANARLVADQAKV